MISEYENTVRRLIISILGSDDSSPYNISVERINKWKEKRDIQTKKDKGVLFEKRLLYYSDFYDLQTIIFKNWELFLPILKNKKRFEIFFSEVENYRTTLAHGRNLISSQKHLLQGILSDLKNLITIYHNKNEMKDDFFIQILKVNDNLGNVWDSSFTGQKPILRVGDQYELIVDANDPKDRRIEYKIYTLDSSLNIIQDSNCFNFKIDDTMVSQSLTFFIHVRTPDSEYKNQESLMISVTILPK